MSGPKRNPDSLNTFGVVVVGICGAVMVYVAITALQAFYMNDTSEIQTMADYGGQDVTAKGHKADEMQNITQVTRNSTDPNGTYRIKIEDAMKEVVDSAATDPTHLIPTQPASVKPTIQPIFGRPKPLATPTPVAPTAPATGSGAAPATGSGDAGSAAAGSAAANTGAAVVPTSTNSAGVAGSSGAGGTTGTPATQNAGSGGAAAATGSGGHAR